MTAFADRHQTEDVVPIADAGTLSASKAHGDVVTDGQLIDTITPPRWSTKETDASLAAEPVCTAKGMKGLGVGEGYSAKRAASDAKTLTRQENRAKAVIAERTAARTRGSSRPAQARDEESLARARCGWSSCRARSRMCLRR